VPLPRDSVRADVGLDHEPRRGVSLLLQDAPREPLRVEASGVLDRLGKRDVDDVVRAAREETRSLLVVDRVVGRCHELAERACRARVANGAERLGVGHRHERTNAPEP